MSKNKEIKSIIFVTDIRMNFEKTQEVFAGHSAGAYEQWKPFINAGANLKVIARKGQHENGVLSSGPGVAFVYLPDYNNFKSLFKSLPRIINIIGKQTSKSVFFLRLPEPLSILSAFICLITRTPYIANIVVDPSTSIPNTAFQKLLYWLTRILSKKAFGNVYVSSRLLKVYPPGDSMPLVRSDVVIDKENLALTNQRSLHRNPKQLVLVGTNQSLVKGQDIALEALAELRKNDDYKLVFVGGGRMISWLEDRAIALGIRDHVRFTGEIHERKDLDKILDESDAFILPSRSEGLPRAMLEAMSHGLPSVGSNVGGVPDLLPHSLVMVEYTSQDLVKCIEHIFDNPYDYEILSKKMLQKAREISDNAEPERLEQYIVNKINTLN